MATTTTTSNIKYETLSAADVPGLQGLEDVRKKMTDLFNNLDQTYANLVNSGREQEALQLREASERMSRVGSRAGVNAFTRQALIQDLQNKMRISSRVLEDADLAKKLDSQQGVLRDLANLSQNVWTALTNYANDKYNREVAQEQQGYDRSKYADETAYNRKWAEDALARQLAAQRQSLYQSTKKSSTAINPIVPGKSYPTTPVYAPQNPMLETPGSALDKWFNTPSSAQTGGNRQWGEPVSVMPGVQVGGPSWGTPTAPVTAAPTTTITPGALPSTIQETSPGVFTNAPKQVAATPTTVAKKAGVAAAPLPTGFVKSGIADWVNNLWGGTPFGQAAKTVQGASKIGNWLGANW